MELSYLDIAIKLTMGLLSLVLVINISGKGNLAPSSAMDQVLNYVLGGIVGGVIYNPGISVLQYFIILMIWTIIVVLQDEENPKYPIITDGIVQTNVLEVIDKDTEWLEAILKEMGYENISNIFLAEYDNGKINVVTY